MLRDVLCVVFIVIYYCLDQQVLQRMNISVGIAKPHYINRNEQYEKKQAQHHIKTKKQVSHVPVPKSHTSDKLQLKQDDLKVEQLKKWLLSMINQWKANLQEELMNKRKIVMGMRKEHQDRLEHIFKQIQQIRKKAYEQYKHVCNKKSESGDCGCCTQRRNFFSQQVHSYLNIKKKKFQTNSKQNKFESQIHKKAKYSSQKTSRVSIKTNTNSNKSLLLIQNTSNGQIQQVRQQNKEGQKDKAQKNSIFRKDKNTDRFSTERENIDTQGVRGQKERKSTLLNNSKKSCSSIPPQLSSKDLSSRSKDDIVEPKNHFQRSNSIRHSVLKTSVRKSEQPKPHTVRLSRFVNAQSELIYMHSNSKPSKPSKLSKFDQPHVSAAQQEEIDKNSYLKRKGVLNRNNKYVKKNEIENSVEVQIEEQEDRIQVDGVKTSKDEIEQLVKQKMVEKQVQKVSRYQRQRMFYHLLKKELLRESRLKSPTAIELQEIHDYSTPQQNEYYLLHSSDSDPTLKSPSSLKRYSLAQRKQSLMSKLAMLNQSNAFQNIKGQIDDLINRNTHKIQAKQEKQDKNSLKNIVNVFLSEVLKISDLKRLTKEKFFRESVWSPQMRQMHQFCTYLQYSLQAFQTNLKKTTESNWKQLSLEGKALQSTIDDLILDNRMGNFKDIDLSDIGEQNHRQIECSMKYYGIDIQRLNRYKQIFDDLPSANLINPTAIVEQKSMKQIQQMKQNAIPQNQ